MFKFLSKMCLLFCVIFAVNALRAATINEPSVGDVIRTVKNEIFGVSLASTKDPRVIGVVVAGLLTMGVGAALVYTAFSDDKEAQRSSTFAKICAFLFGDVCLVSGLATVLFSRTIITSVDERTVYVLQELNKARLSNLPK